MFALTEDDLSKHILGAADGPASFNTELTNCNGSVVSLDPIYGLAPKDIKQRFDQVLPNILKQVDATPKDWVWDYHSSPAQLRERRIEVTNRFIKDFTKAKGSSRYVEGTLPNLPFPDHSFEIALCSHFLFLYADRFPLEFHVRSICEMLRVAPEIRIFPLIQLDLKRPIFLKTLIAKLEDKNFIVSIEKVKYELQRGGNEMLRIRR